VDHKLDDVSEKLSMILHVNKVHFTKMTDFMEQKFSTAVSISECLIHTAYNNQLSPGALHHEVLVEIVKYINDIALNSELLSFVHQPSNLRLVEKSYIYKPDENTFVLVRVHPPAGTLQLFRQCVCHSRSWHKQHDRCWSLTILPTHFLL